MSAAETSTLLTSGLCVAPETVRRCSAAIARPGTTRMTLMDPQLDPAERAFRFDDHSDYSPSLPGWRLAHWLHAIRAGGVVEMPLAIDSTEHGLKRVYRCLISEGRHQPVLHRIN